MASGLVSMKEIQNRNNPKTASAPVVSTPAAAPTKSKSGIVPMSEIKSKRAVAQPASVLPEFNPISADPSQSAMMQFISSQPQTKPFAAPNLHPDNSTVMQQANTYNAAHPDDSAWNGIFDNPIVHGVETGLAWAQKPFETISTVLADTSGAVNNLFGSEKRMGYDGKQYIVTPSQSRNVFNDIKNIWSKTNEHISSDAWAGESPNLGKIDGTSANWTDAIDFGAQFLSPTKFVTGPLKIARQGANLAKGADKVAFQKAIDDFILKTQTAPVNSDGVSTAYATAGRQGLVQEAPKSSLVPMKEIQAARDPVKPVEAPIAPKTVPAAVKEPTNLDELATFKGHAAATPDTIAQIYNDKNWYHGTGTDKLKGDMLDPNAGNHESLFGQGIYLTDNPDIAQGYANSRGKRSGTPTVYESNVNMNKVLDLEKPVTPDVREVLYKMTEPLDYSYNSHLGEKKHFTNLLNRELAKPDATPEKVILAIKEEIGNFSHEAELSTNEFVEDFQDLAQHFKEAGYDGLTHTGGLRQGKDPHRVLIMLDPQNWHGATEGLGSQVTRFDKYEKPVAAETAAAAEAPSNLVKMADIQAMRAKGTVSAQAPRQPRSLETAAAQEDVKNYAGNHMPFRAAAGQTDRTINRNKVISNLRKNLGVTIDTGRLGPGTKNVLGIYKTTPEVIRSGMAEDIQTISHEVGHHLDKKFKLQDPQFKSELDQLMQFTGHNTGAYTAAQQLEEGIAEYVRLYLTDSKNAFKYAPKFTDHFESLISPKALKGLEATADDIDTWITQGDYEQAKGLIDFDGSAEKAPINKSKLYTRFVDDLNPIQLAEKALKGVVGIGKDSMYKMARLSRGVAERAKLAATRGIYDAAGNKVGEGLRDIVKPLEELGIKERDFSTYLAVKHAIDLKAMGKRVPFTDEQITAVLNRLDTPEVQAVQKKIVEYNDHLMDILVDAQILDPMTVTAMRKKYPNYVPMMRYFDEDAAAGFKAGGFGAAKGFANITNPVKRMSEEGSYRTIINPIESMVKNTFLVMNAAAKNKVGLQLAEMAKIEGAGSWVEKVSGGSSPHEHVVNVFENGERQAYKIRDPELYNAMLSLDAEASNSLIKFLGGTAGLLRAGATLTPEFMIRNAMRDVVGAMINSTKYGFTPVDFFKGMYHVLSKSKILDQFLSSGGAMGTLMSLDRDVSREALQQVFRKSLKEKAMNVVTNPKELAKMLSGYTPIKSTVNVLRKGAEISELSTKVGVFNKTLKKTGSIEEAAYTAKDLMDFNRAGSSIRQANRAIAFMNAGIQGTDRVIRSFKDNPASFLTRAFTTLVLPATAIHYWNENLRDDLKAKYDNIPQWQKDTFFVFNIPGTDQFARIPKPFEAGMLFATGTERLLNWTKEHDPKAWKNYGTTILQSLSPPTLFTALTPLLEAITNYSFFRKAPVVPQGEQGLEKVDQYGPYTSEVAKNLGKAATFVGLGDKAAASPRIIDNTIQGYTAGLGQYAIDGLDKVLEGVGSGDKVSLPAKKWYEQPVIRSFTATTSGGGQIRQDFYDKWSDLSKAKASATRNEKDYNDPMYDQMAATKAYIDDALKQYKIIQKDKDMNSEEKRVQLDKLDGIINTAAAQALGEGGIK